MDLLSKMIALDPAKRISGEDSASHLGGSLPQCGNTSG